VLPLRDNIPSATRPTVTWAIIVANLLAFFWELSGANVLPWTLIPARFTSDHFVKVANHGWVWVRSQHATEKIVRGADVGDPVAHGFVDGVF